MRYLSWFSCGAASAVASKLAVYLYGDSCEVVYCDTMETEHPDNQRFFDDVQRWIGKPIVKLHSSRYTNIDDVFIKRRYLAGINGALCTTEMKKFPRIAYQQPDDVHIFGYTADRKEEKRAERFEVTNPELHVEWLLIEHGITKQLCLDHLEYAGIKLPAMYALGFDHNNCIGCVKSASPGYWNRVRRLFPEVFNRRCAQSRYLGVRLVKLHGQRIFLDELPPDAEAPDDDIDCGPVCQIPDVESFF